MIAQMLPCGYGSSNTGECGRGVMAYLPHVDEVLGVLCGGGIFRIEFEVVLHTLMDHGKVIGGFAGIAIATGVFAAF